MLQPIMPPPRSLDVHLFGPALFFWSSWSYGVSRLLQRILLAVMEMDTPPPRVWMVVFVLAVAAVLIFNVISCPSLPDPISQRCSTLLRTDGGVDTRTLRIAGWMKAFGPSTRWQVAANELLRT